ncbi:MAG: 1,6-anhydro-N-acetylmuramyl-L-alanine amidase AmpD [Kangiellaceae bacterium]
MKPKNSKSTNSKFNTSLFDYSDALVENGWLSNAKISACCHFDSRPNSSDISLLVIHNISLPAGAFNNSHVEDFFAGCINVEQHKSFLELANVRVSSHLFIKRSGEIVQFVGFNERAWHAGVSSFKGKEKCNDYSIGIELEGTDTTAYTDEQYTSLVKVTQLILTSYPLISPDRICGHSDIAPGRKTDPGDSFDWNRYLNAI